MFLVQSASTGSVKFSLQQERVFVSSKRDSLQIVLEILRTVAVHSSSITQIVYHTNLNHESAERYLALLSRRGLVGIGLTVEGRRVYTITEHGGEVSEYLEKSLSSILES